MVSDNADQSTGQEVTQSTGQEVDERGIPVFDKSLVASPFCPPKPCMLCDLRSLTVQESYVWCQKMNTCAATIDWDRVYGH